MSTKASTRIDIGSPEILETSPRPLPAALCTRPGRPTVPRRARPPMGRPARRPATPPHRKL